MVFKKCAECKNLVNRGFFVECKKGLTPFSCTQEPLVAPIIDKHEETLRRLKNAKWTEP